MQHYTAQSASCVQLQGGSSQDKHAAWLLDLPMDSQVHLKMELEVEWKRLGRKWARPEKEQLGPKKVRAGPEMEQQADFEPESGIEQKRGQTTLCHQYEHKGCFYHWTVAVDGHGEESIDLESTGSGCIGDVH